MDSDISPLVTSTSQLTFLLPQCNYSPSTLRMGIPDKTSYLSTFLLLRPQSCSSIGSQFPVSSASWHTLLVSHGLLSYLDAIMLRSIFLPRPSGLGRLYISSTPATSVSRNTPYPPFYPHPVEMVPRLYRFLAPSDCKLPPRLSKQSL